MPKFDRYLLSNIFSGTIIALIFLLTIDFLVQSGEEISSVGEGNYTLTVMLTVLFFQLPERIIEFTPAAILVGSILSLGQLATQQELIVAQTAGMSRLRIVRSGIFLALVFGCLLIAIAEFISPQSSQKSEEIRNFALGKTTQTAYSNGLWFNDKKQQLIHIASLSSDGSLNNLHFYRRQNNTIEIQTAEKAIFNNNSWILEKPQKWTFTPEKIIQIPTEQYWQTTATPENLYQIAAKKNSGTISELLALNNFLKSNSLPHQKESLELWQRIFLPISALTMLLLALPFVFKTSRGTNGSRLLIGIVLGTLYYIIQGIISSLAILLNFPPLIGALLPNILLGIPPLFILMRS